MLRIQFLMLATFIALPLVVASPPAKAGDDCDKISFNLAFDAEKLHDDKKLTDAEFYEMEVHVQNYLTNCTISRCLRVSPHTYDCQGFIDWQINKYESQKNAKDALAKAKAMINTAKAR